MKRNTARIIVWSIIFAELFGMVIIAIIQPCIKMVKIYGPIGILYYIVVAALALAFVALVGYILSYLINRAK